MKFAVQWGLENEGGAVCSMPNNVLGILDILQ